jgi:hypothetical protein
MEWAGYQMKGAEEVRKDGWGLWMWSKSVICMCENITLEITILYNLYKLMKIDLTRKQFFEI